VWGFVWLSLLAVENYITTMEKQDCRGRQIANVTCKGKGR